MSKIYLGVDKLGEGNLEVFVAVLSKDKKDIEPNKELTKILESKNTTSIFKDRAFKHILIRQEYREELNPAEIQAMVLYEFIFKYKDLGLVIVNYKLPEKVTQEEVTQNLERMLKPRECPEIRIEPGSDPIYNIVCAANLLSPFVYDHYEKLFKEHGSLASDEKYDKHLIILKEPIFYRRLMK